MSTQKKNTVPADKLETLFMAYGIVQKEYVTVPDTLLRNTKELRKYFEQSYQYAQTLKPKPTKKK